ncbi:hypothetical protein NPIL_400151 [Nephila pilipes]|uniref:Uncharacterized protein n=1 Tax=Nephila pilipes TaxID=299642 RepID=A0A8X6J0Z1_NEPPI|nr:hypothetical protein NPIL_400151 [Nephila pilipes]
MVRTKQVVSKKKPEQTDHMESTDSENNLVEDLETMNTKQDDTDDQNLQDQDACLIKMRPQEKFLEAINYYHCYCAMSDKISRANAGDYGENQNKVIEFHIAAELK